MTSKNTISVRATLIVLLIVMALPGFAQQSQTAGPKVDQAGDFASTLEEVVVTAQKRQERAMDVPISLAVVDARQIAADSARTLVDIVQTVPDVTFSSAPNTKLSSVSIRGVGSNSRNIGEDTRVGVYLDGVYIGQSANIDQQLLNIERIEVLRGPQGTLFGKNTDAGAINIVTKAPTETFGASVDADLGNYSARVYSGTINIPTGETSALSLGILNAKREGFLYNLYDGAHLADENRTQAVAQFIVRPTTDFTVRLSADYYSARHETWQQPIPITDTFGRTLPPYNARFYNVDFNYTPTLDTVRGGAAATLAYQFDGGIEVRSISAYRYTYQDGRNDSDYSALDAVGADEGDWYKQVTQEFQLLSAKNQHFEWLAGAYYYRQSGYTNRNVLVGSYGPSVGLLSDPHALTQGGVVTTQSFSLYGDGTYHISEPLAVSAGLRVETESKSANWIQEGSLAAEAGLAEGRYVDSIRNNAFTPEFNLTYKLSEGASTFFRFARGAKSGGFNLDYIAADLYPDHLRYKPESSTDYELGLKGKAKNLSYSVTAFVTNYTDLQANKLELLSPGHPGYVIGNVGARTKGVEFEGSYQVTRGLLVDGSFSVLSAICSACVGAGDNGTDATGQRLPGVSNPQAFIRLVLDNNLGSTNLRWRGDITSSYIGPSFSSFSTAYTATLPSGLTIPYNHVAGRSLTDLRFSLFPEKENWQASLWARNVFDKEYVYSYGSDLFGTLTTDRGLPRMFGVNLQINF